MTVIGIHDIVGGVASHMRGGLTSDGGLSLILVDGLLLVPLGMAAFFYPVTAALIGAAVVAVAVGVLILSRASGMCPACVTTFPLVGLSDMSKGSVKSSFEHDVLESPVPVLVDFWAPWCGPCRMQSPIVDAISQTEATRARVVKINVDEEPELTTRFGVASTPTLLLFSKGQVRQRFVGLQSATTLVAALRSAAAE